MAKRRRVKSKVDRISALPNELLLRILSFFPTKFAASNSVLSKRWRNLLTLMTNLDFCDNKAKLIQPQQYMNCVDRVLLFPNRPSIHRFCLKYRKFNIALLPIDKWIDALICKNIQEIELVGNYNWPSKLQIPASLFSCKTLVTLKLLLKSTEDYYTVNIPARTSLPKLKVLHIIHASMSGRNVENMLSSCPVLDDLVLRYCHLETSRNCCKFNVSNSTLTRLTISVGWKNRDRQIVINSPALVYLKYDIWDNQSLTLLAKDSLDTVVIDGCLLRPPARYNRDVLKEMTNIQSLEIQGGTIQGIYDHNLVIPLFDRLTYLKIWDWKFMGNARLLKNLLAQCVVLETLVFECYPLCWARDGTSGNQQLRRADLMCHLKIIKIHYNFIEYDEFKALMQIIKFFLNNAEVLEDLTILIREFSQKLEIKKEEIKKELLALPRVSKQCRVVLDVMN